MISRKHYTMRGINETLRRNYREAVEGAKRTNG